MSFDTEQLFQAIDIIVDKRLEDLYFDKTLVCTIKDDINKKNGQYTVSDGAISFIAYGESIYNNGDQVRVSVPNGDFTQTKFIEGKYIPTNSITPISYISSLENIIDMSGDLVNSSNIYSIAANSNINSEIEIAYIDLTKSEYEDIIQNSIYDILYIKADVKTNFKNKIVSGSYGVKIGLFLNENSKTPDKYLYFDSSLMIGDPYQFSTYFQQIQKFDISFVGSIYKLKISLYQKNNFKYYTTTETKEFLSPMFNTNNEEIQNIFFKNITVGFGLSVNEVSDNTVKLYTSGNLNYNDKNEIGSNNRKISLLWVNKDEKNNYLGFSDGVYDLKYDENTEAELEKNYRYSIYWYRYCPNCATEFKDSNDKLTSNNLINWVKIPNSNNIGLPSSGHIGINNEMYYDKKPNKNEGFLNVTLDLGAAEERIMAVVVYNHQVYYSEPLIFTNLLGYRNISIQHDLNSSENYLLYNKNGKLINPGEKDVQRTLKVSFDNPENLIGSTVYWFIPKDKTMLRTFVNDTFVPIEETDSLYKEDYYGYSKTINSDQDYYFSYKINDYYLSTYSKNSIICIIKNTDYRHLETEIKLKFGVYNYKIDDYTIQIESINEQMVVTKDTPLDLIIRVIDKEGNKIQLSDEYFILSHMVYEEPQETDESQAQMISEEELTSRKFGEEKEFSSSTITFDGPSPYTIEYLGVDTDDPTLVKCRITYDEDYIDLDIQTLYAVLKIIIYFYPTESLTGYFPIPFAKEGYYIKGTTTITYDEDGKNPEYYKGNYELYDWNTSEEITENIEWIIKYCDSNGLEIQEDEIPSMDILATYMPTLNDSNSLSVCNNYLYGENLYLTVYCFKDNEIYWAQPLYITIDRNGYLNLTGEKEMSTSAGNIVQMQGGQMIYDSSDQSVNGIVIGSVEKNYDEYQDIDTFGIYVYSKNDEVVRIDPKTVKIIGKKIEDGITKQIVIDTSAEKYPFQINYNSSDIKYSLDWDGNISANIGSFQKLQLAEADLSSTLTNVQENINKLDSSIKELSSFKSEITNLSSRVATLENKVKNLS